MIIYNNYLCTFANNKMKINRKAEIIMIIFIPRHSTLDYGADLCISAVDNPTDEGPRKLLLQRNLRD